MTLETHNIEAGNHSGEQKAIFRQKQVAQRRRTHRQFSAASVEKACHNLIAAVGDVARVAVYASARSELSPELATEHFWAAGIEVYFPRSLPTGFLAFHKIDSFKQLQPGRFGIGEPAESVPSSSTFDAIVVPGLAFGRDGSRMGMGRGFYDRTLPTLLGRRIGFGYHEQLFETLPTDAHDCVMDSFVCEDDILHLSTQRRKTA